MKLPSWHQLKQGLIYFFLNLATPVTFYWSFHEWGPKAAIGFAVGISGLQTLTHFIFKVRPSPIFIFSSGFTFLFGGIDLWIQSPKFYRFEPFAQNLSVATLALISVGAKIPLAYEMIRALPQSIQPKSLTPQHPALGRISWAWIIYLYLKALFYFYLAFRVDLADLILLRTVVGGGSMIFMLLLLPLNFRRKSHKTTYL